MTVYVDHARNRLGRMRMSHMTADTIAELHEMAAAVGLRREWFQGPPEHRHAHYDLCQAKRADAVARGARVTNSRIVARKARSLAGALS